MIVMMEVAAGKGREEVHVGMTKFVGKHGSCSLR